MRNSTFNLIHLKLVVVDFACCLGYLTLLIGRLLIITGGVGGDPRVDPRLKLGDVI